MGALAAPSESTAGRLGSAAARAATISPMLRYGTSGSGTSLPTSSPSPGNARSLLLLGRGLFLTELLDHLLLGRARHRLVLGELHGVLALALGGGAEVRRIEIG